MVARTASFAVVHFVVAFSVGYAITGSVLAGGTIALIEPAINSVAYFFHEMAWNKAGKTRPILEEVFANSVLVK